MDDETGEIRTSGGFDAAPVRRWTGVDLLTLASISVVAAALRLLFIEQWSFAPAEASTWRALTTPLVGEAASFSSSPEVAYPLVFLLLRELLDQGLLPSMTEGWLRLPFAFAGCVVAPLVALVARPLMGRPAAVLAAFAVAVHPACVVASQTAEPVVFAVGFALLAGVLSMRGWGWMSALAVLVAGGCHPLGWLAGFGLALAVRSPQWLRRAHWSWLLALTALASPLIPELGYGHTWLAVLLAGLSVGLWLPSARGLALAALLPLAASGVWWWWDPAVGVAARAITAPVVVALASYSCVQFARAIGARLGATRPVTRLVGVAPTLMMLAELMTGSFLYFVVYEGDRSAWRDARSAVAAARAPGADLCVVAGRGVDVLRTYLRPNHWREPGADLHPGIVVEALAADGAGRAEQSQRDDVLFVLLQDERDSMGAAAADLVVVTLWPSPKAVGDGSLYVMRRRSSD